MIIKALYDYYERKHDELAPFGMEDKEIAFSIVLDRNGNFIRFNDHRQDTNHSDSFIVVRSVDRTSNIMPNVLWDNLSYVIGKSNKKGSEDAESVKKYESFRNLVETIYTWIPDNEQIKSVYKFYQQERSKIIAQFSNDPLWQDILKEADLNISFKIRGCRGIVAEDKDIINRYLELDANKYNTRGICMITGQESFLVPTTFMTPIRGGQRKAKLVSFQPDSGFDSYGKSKGYNAPISREAEFAYTTALNHLLGKDSNNKFILGDKTYVFWASSNNDISKQFENSFFSLFVREDNPDRNVLSVKQTFLSIFSGKEITGNEDKFYILGLAPNKARIAVVYWYEQSMKEFAKHILRHFDFMDIVEDKDYVNKPYAGLYTILKSLTYTPKGKEAKWQDYIPPKLTESIMRSILEGSPYPAIMLLTCIQRIRAGEKINRPRAAIIKAYLNRLNNNHQKIKVMLDLENTNQAYLCGRLLAVLERIQYCANNSGRDSNNTFHSICEKYMSAASSSPVTVFPTLLSLSIHHSEKLEYAKGKYEKLKDEIMDKIHADGFPAHLDLCDQGRFFVGYYHQRQAFFLNGTQSEISDENESANE